MNSVGIHITGKKKEGEKKLFFSFTEMAGQAAYTLTEAWKESFMRNPMQCHDDVNHWMQLTPKFLLMYKSKKTNKQKIT